MTNHTLVVMGQGYVGLPIAMRAVAVGYNVVGVEVDATRAAQLASAQSYVADVTSAELQAALDTGRYRAVVADDRSLAFDTALITVPTPLRDGAPDLSFIEEAATFLASRLARGATVVLESTTYPGTTEQLLVPILEQGSGLTAGTDFYVGYSPERIDPGNSEWFLANTPKVVSGINEESLKHVTSFYARLVDQPVPVSSPKEAELTKLLENTFRHVNIALVNELAMFAHELGIDLWEAIDAASTKPFGYFRFTPGPGVGGHCLPIDPSYLSWRVQRQLGQPFRFVELANDINEHMPDYVVRRATEALNRRKLAVNGARVLVAGLAYKKNTSDAREAPSMRVISRLAFLGAEVHVADPHVKLIPQDLPGKVVNLTAGEAEWADLAILLIDHDAFDLTVLRAVEVLDTRHVLAPAPTVEYL